MLKMFVKTMILNNSLEDKKKKRKSLLKKITWKVEPNNRKRPNKSKKEGDKKDLTVTHQLFRREEKINRGAQRCFKTGCEDDIVKNGQIL